MEKGDNNLYRVYFNANPIAQADRRAGIITQDRYRELEGFNNADLVINTHKKVDEIAKALVVQSRSLDAILKMAKTK